MADIKLGGFTLGIDNRSDETSLPKGTARDAYNVTINNAGGFGRRDGATLLAASTEAHSLWSPAHGAYALYAKQDTVRRLTVDEQGAVGALVLVSGLTPTGAMSYCESADSTFFTNGIEIGRISPKGAKLLGVPEPIGSPSVKTGAGGLTAGKYGCAYSYLTATGEESALSLASFINLPTGGGITFALPPAPSGATQVRLYTTPVNGDVFYEMAQIPAGLVSFTIGDNTPGKQASTQYLRRMPGGSIVRMFKGRLVVIKGDTLIFSEPFQYGLTSPRHNFVSFGSDVTMIEPVEGGMYVGTAEQVYFLNGSGPKDFTQSAVSANVPVPGTSTTIRAEMLPKDYAEMSSMPAALWLGPNGYSIGMYNGIVHNIQAERLLLPGYTGGSTVTYSKNGLSQVFSVVHSQKSNLDLTSFDSI